MEVSTYIYQQWLSEGLGVTFKGQGKKWDEEEDAKDVVNQIEECSNLKFLELEGNTLGVGASKAIGKALESKRELEAALWKDLFTGRLKNEIPQSFNYLFAGVDLAGAHLQRLDLSDNAIGPVGMVGLGPFFKTASSFSLKELILNNNGFGPEGGSSLADALLECLRLSKEFGGQIFQLRVFVCGRNRLENKAARRLAEFFKEVQTLEEVYMPQNGIYKEGIAALASGLRNNKGMKVLNLNDNTIRGEGIVELAGAIAEMGDLQELSLSDCLLKSGVLKIVDALKSHGTIKKINFSGNEICSSVGKQAAEAMRSLRDLEEVNLDSNSLGTEGTEFVTNMLTSANVIIEEDDGTEDEEENSEDEGANNEPSNAYEDISSDDQEEPVDMKALPQSLKQSAIEIFMKEPSESNFQLLDKTSPYDVLKQHLSDSTVQDVDGLRYITLALKISAHIQSERKLGKEVSECLVNVFMNLMSDGMQAGPYLPNEFVTFFFMASGLFRAEKEVVSSVSPLNDMTLYCMCKWLTERNVSANIAFYIYVISHSVLRERAGELDIKENSVNKIERVAKEVYLYYSQKTKNPTTFAVPQQQTA